MPDQQAASVPLREETVARTMGRQRLVEGGEILTGGIKKEAHACSKNARCASHNQGCLQFWFSAIPGTKSCYATTQLMLYERTLPTLTTPGIFPMPTLFAQIS